tara:strand:- start:310 stop:612 length:303 start_codon:yes stop_codon:yes gene_type:complete
MFFLILDIFDRIVQTNSVIVGFLMIPVCILTYMFCWGCVFSVLEKVITIPRLTSLIQNQNVQIAIVAIDFAIWFYLAVLEGDLSNFPIGGGPPTLFDGLY